MKTLGDELRKHLEAAGYGERGGQEKWREYLAVHKGVIVSAEAVSAWLRGDRRPSASHLVAILDSLGVHGDERVRLVNLAYGLGLSTSNRVEV